MDSSQPPPDPSHSTTAFLQRIGISASLLSLLQQPAWADPEAAAYTFGQAGQWHLPITLLAILTAASLSMMEAALTTVRRSRIEQLVDEGSAKAARVQQLLADPLRVQFTTRVLVTLSVLCAAGMATHGYVEPTTAWLISTGLVGGGRIASSAAFAVVMLIVSIIVLVFAEVTPRSIASRLAEPIALNLAAPFRLLQTAAWPLVAAIQGMASVFVRPFGVRATFQGSALSEDELKIMVEQSEESGVIETSEKEMIARVFDLSDTPVRQVMTPRLDMTCLPVDSTLDEFLRLVGESGHSRIPLYEDVMDNIVGLVHAKDALASLTPPAETESGRRRRPVRLRALMRKPYFVPDSKRVDDLLTEFRRLRLQLAVVRDEYGTVVGLVTVEDILEEIVGEIQDEYDLEEPEYQRLDSHTWLIDARMSIDDFNERTGADLPEDETDTVGGFVFSLLGRQPEHGDCGQFGGMEFRVEETDGRRIQRVRVIRTNGDTSSPTAPPSELKPV